MSKTLAKLLYRVLIFPLIFLGVHFLAIFSKKIRVGLFPRYKTLIRLKEWAERQRGSNRIILIHAASLGEFEHVKPLLYRFKSDYALVNVVTFFSPSGYLYIKEFNFLDFYLYMPFDTRRIWRKFYTLLNPYMIIIAKHDVWPAQIWTARELNIPVYLINGSLAENSTRTRPVVKNFLRTVYRDFEKIFAISDEDAKRFNQFYPGCNVEVMGDTKYDQVVLRKKSAENQELLPVEWYKGKYIIVAGSTWPEDEEHLFPALKKLLLKYNQVNLILIPHQPDEKAIKTHLEFFKDWDAALFSNRERVNGKRIIITDVVGYLASLYNYADVAYVGGSFKQGVHNVMEPAIFGVPVLYGPVHKNSYEAIKLAEHNGGIVVHNSSDIQSWLEKFIQDTQLLRSVGVRAEKFALLNTGATNRLLASWEPVLH